MGQFPEKSLLGLGFTVYSYIFVILSMFQGSLIFLQKRVPFVATFVLVVARTFPLDASKSLR